MKNLIKYILILYTEESISYINQYLQTIAIKSEYISEGINNKNILRCYDIFLLKDEEQS